MKAKNFVLIATLLVSSLSQALVVTENPCFLKIGVRMAKAKKFIFSANAGRVYYIDRDGKSNVVPGLYRSMDQFILKNSVCLPSKNSPMNDDQAVLLERIFSEEQGNVTKAWSQPETSETAK